MPNFAVLNNNIVTNVIVADTQEVAEQVTGSTCIEITGDAGIGCSYIDGVFVHPVVEEPVNDQSQN